jgi:hypothetical protein
MLTKFRKRRVLWPLLIFILELAAYAQNKRDEKNYISGHLQSALNNETSGIAASQIHANTYYIHNDSGDSNRFFAINEEGKVKGIFNYITADAANFGVRDCEDIAVGPGTVAGKNYVYVGDIGDNGSSAPYIMVYRVPEPEQLPAVADSAKNIVGEALYFKYPDGAKDAETLMIDPLEKLFYIVTKRHSFVSVYTAPLNIKGNDTVTLTKRCDLRFKGLKPFKWIVSGDISKDGTQVLLKSYSRVYYWKRNGNEPIWQTLQRTPEQPVYEQERLGEAISFAADGKSYYTVSEGSKQPIYHYVVPKSK